MTTFFEPRYPGEGTCRHCGGNRSTHFGAVGVCPQTATPAPLGTEALTREELEKRFPPDTGMRGQVRHFETGATRNAAWDKLDYEGFLSPSVLQRFATYMHAHRKQTDGILRDSDNWKKGIPQEVYMKSLVRHTIDFWAVSRGVGVVDKDSGEQATAEDLACAILFNAMGWLYENLKSHTQER